jgi:hypothetical protein
MSNTIIPSDRSRINAILTRTRQTRMARGLARAFRVGID